jgi:hypothetical protein
VDDAPYTGDLDLGAVSTRDGLASCMQTVRTRADMSLRTLEAMTRRSDNPLSKTTVAEMLKGERFPRKAMMIAFLRACGVKDDSMELWLRAWERVAAREQGPSESKTVRTARETKAGKAGNEEQAALARTDRNSAVTSASAGFPEPGKLGHQAGELSLGVSEVSAAELRVFGAELTQTLRMRRKTTEEAAAELAVPSANVARWAAGQELPSESQARSLDEYLMARGAIQNLVANLRSRPDRLVSRHRVLLPSPPGPTLLQTFRNVAAALRNSLSKDADRRPTGWPPDLRVPGAATPLSTAYGIRTMLLLEDGLAADLIPVAESLLEMASEGGGYAGREQVEPRTESTAVVLNTLLRIAATVGFDTHVAEMQRDLGDFENHRPFILTTMLETSLLLKSAPRLVETLVDNLLATRRPYEDFLLWPEKTEALLIDPAPSVAHTARAVRVLANVQQVRPSSPVQEALEEAVAWLLEQDDLHTTHELIERPIGGRPELVPVRHFTAAWVVKALVSAGVPTSNPAVGKAVTRIWDRYASDAALWAWDNGDLPIWMTFDAVEALRLANLAIPARPLGLRPSDIGTP